LPRVPLSLSLLLAVLALVVVGCGESKDEKFKKDFRPVNDRILELFEGVGTTLQGVGSLTNDQIEREFGRFAQDLGDLREDVDHLEPPEDLEGKKRNLLHAMRDTESPLRGIRRAADKRNPAAAGRATRRLIFALVELRRARRSLAKETGAKLGP
jgi:hypothetical protein